MIRHGIAVLSAVLGMVLATASWAQTVTRGPYLQTLTDSSVIVRWRTDLATDSVVRYGVSAASLTSTETVGGSRTEHSVTLTGLADGSQYFYSVGDSVGPLAGDASYHFGTAPVPGTPTPTRIWVIGDAGTANTHPGQPEAVRDAFKAYAASSPADFMLMLGDNAYPDGTDQQYQDAVFDTYPELLRQLPVWSCLGNHDGHSADSTTQSGPYYDMFEFPTAAEAGGLASGTEAYYSFDYGNIHVVVLDSYDTNRSPTGNMLQWLEADLAFNDKPWVIAIWHHPPYTKGSHNSDTEGQLVDMRQNAVPVLEAWGVDLVMTGHSHSYERSMLIDGHYGVASTWNATNHAVDSGDGLETGDGAYEKPDVVAAENAGAVYAVNGSSGKVSGVQGDWPHPAMTTYLTVLGSMVLDVAGNRMDVVFLDDGGTVQDEFTILKTPDLEPPLLSDANAEDASHVIVDFSERVDAPTAGDDLNYSIAGLAVTSAELLSGNRSVRLTTSVMTPGASYVLTVNNVQDENGNTIAPNSQIGFDFIQFMTKSFQDGLAPDTGYAGSFDAYIREASATTNYGSATTLQVDGDEPSGSGTDMNILLGWDISEIPVTAIVDSASIHLNNLNVGGPYYCFALLRAWNEAEVTWNQASAGNTWGASGAEAGSDRDSLTLCTVSAGTTGPLLADLNSDGLDLVQDWIDGSQLNHGLVITDTVTTNGADFDSRESTTAMNRPRLEVTYHVPVTGPNPPAAPSGLGAATWSSAVIDLAWTDNANDEDGFRVERSPDGLSGWQQVASLAADTSIWSDSGLAAGSTWHYRVLAYNTGGDSAWSSSASDTTFTSPRTIQFAGRNWTVKAAGSPVGPGPNLFGDTADDVWVDGSGHLHLRIEFRNGNWHSSEVIGDDVLGHGTYTFTLGSRVDLLDRNIVVGLFTWDSSAPEFNYREIDIEFALWGDPLADNSQNVVQPWDTPGNINRWDTTLTGNDSTHAFTWHPDRVEFSSHQGDPPGAEIQSWTYNGPDVPPEGTTSGNARINFWQRGGFAPFNGQEAELVIKSFDFTPLPAGSADHTAIADLPSAGTVSGTYNNTGADDGTSQSVRERESGGKKSNRYGYLRHTWQFNIPPSAMATLHGNIWHGGSTDDDFELSWSTDNSNFTPLFTVTSTDPANQQQAILPGAPSGNVYIRVTDTDQTPGNRSLDTVFIDHLFIRTENASGTPPDAPSGLNATANGHDQVDLVWTDNSIDESGFSIERSSGGGSFVEVGIAGADQTAWPDTGLTGSTTYDYRVLAFNASGASAPSNVASATTDPPPPPPAISLSLSGYKQKGRHIVDLDWSGTTTSNVDIYRDNLSTLLVTVPDTGAWTDQTGNKGGRTYNYQVCEAGTSNCSAVETISF